MAKIEIYTNPGCPACVNAKQFLDKKGVQYEEKKLGRSTSTDLEFRVKTRGAKSVPQIFIDGKLIGGFDDLLRFDKDDELDWRIGKSARPKITLLQRLLRLLKGHRY